MKYINEHKEKVSENNNKWYNEHKEERAIYNAQWRIKNKDAVLQRQELMKEIIHCDKCNTDFTRHSLTSHNKSKMYNK
jgi:hypothetical protein